MDVKALFSISYGLYVLSTRDADGVDAGCIINTVMQVTEAPPRLVIAVNKVTNTHDAVLRAGCFNLSLLDQSTTFETIKHFGFQSGRDVDKFKTTDLALELTGGAYRLGASSNSFIQCKNVKVEDLGTHSLIVADILDAQFISDKPSLTYQYYQDKVKPKRALVNASQKTVWHCEVCGFEIEADSLADDYICPLCGHGIDAFIKLEPKKELKTIWHCEVCGFEIAADALAGDYICPVCGHGIDAFVKHEIGIDQPLSSVGRDAFITEAAIATAPAEEATPKGQCVWRCDVCGFEIASDGLPDDYVCPWCGAAVDAFKKLEKAVKTIWHCEVCGYELEADSLADDYICPVCKRGIDVFTKHVVDADQPLSTVGRKKAVSKNPSSKKLITDSKTEAAVEAKADEKAGTKIIWHCEVCGYELEADSLADDYICPVCKRGIDVFTKHVVDVDQPLSTVGRKKGVSKSPSSKKLVTDSKTEAAVEAKSVYKGDAKIIWHCDVCGFEIEADSLPDDYVCPLCEAKREAFRKLD